MSWLDKTFRIVCITLGAGLALTLLVVLAGCAPEKTTPVSANVPTAEVTLAPTPEPTFTLPAGPLTAVFFGDSFTDKRGSVLRDVPSWANLISENNDWSEHDLAYGGVGYEVWMGWLNEGQVDQNAGIVFVYGGVNDFTKVYQPAWREVVRLFYQKLRAAVPSAPIIVLSPQWSLPPLPKEIANMREFVHGVVEDVPNACYVDLHDPTFGHPEWVHDDNAHPNAQGQVAIYNALVKGLGECDRLM